MSDFMKLFRLQFKVCFGLGSFLNEWKTNRKSFIKKFVTGLLILLSLGTLAATWVWLLYFIFSGLMSQGMIDMGLLMPFLAGMLIVLVFGVSGVLGILFLSKDIGFLASLPIKQGTVFASKFLLVYLYELFILLLFILPAIIVYGIVAGMSAIFYVKGVAVALLLPMLPLVLSTLLALLLMRFSGLSRRRELFMVVGGFIITIFFVIGQNFLASKLSTMRQDEIMALLAKTNGLVLLIGRAFPPALWAVNAAVKVGIDSVINWLLYLASTLGAFAVAYYIGSKIYLSGALAQLETGKRKKKPAAKNNRYVESSLIKAFAMREFKLIIRSPIYALNSLIGVAMFPLMIIILPMTSGTDPDLQQMEMFLQNLDTSLVFLVSFGVGLLVCTTNMVAGTAVSREGDNFWLSKVIPVSYRIQSYGKLLFSWLVDVTTILLCLAVAFYLLPNFRLMIALAGICATVAAISLNALKLLIDVSRPKLKWSSEAEAMKQNFNGFLAMILSLIVGGAIIFVTYMVGKIPNGALSFILLLGFLTALAFGSVAALGAVSVKVLSKIEQ